MRVPRKSNKIYHFLFAGIDSGKFRPGERIPTELELARLFDVSRPTATLVEEFAAARIAGSRQPPAPYRDYRLMIV